jgi:hypothetical protein
VYRLPDCVIRCVVPQLSEWQRIADQIDAAMIFARADFLNVHFAASYRFVVAVCRAKEAECGA